MVFNFEYEHLEKEYGGINWIEFCKNPGALKKDE